MKASEFIERIQHLIEVAGDVEVVIATGVNGGGSLTFETAAAEAQYVKPMAKRGLYRSTKKSNTHQVIKVY